MLFLTRLLFPCGAGQHLGLAAGSMSPSIHHLDPSNKQQMEHHGPLPESDCPQTRDGTLGNPVVGVSGVSPGPSEPHPGGPVCPASGSRLDAKSFRVCCQPPSPGAHPFHLPSSTLTPRNCLPFHTPLLRQSLSQSLSSRARWLPTLRPRNRS